MGAIFLIVDFKTTYSLFMIILLTRNPSSIALPMVSYFAYLKFTLFQIVLFYSMVTQNSLLSLFFLSLNQVIEGAVIEKLRR